ncbi:sensor histidine kinase [uncultured Draconibacterium sp.]|uniref:ligand-binding sensor domain-containing protein n=1 Tax=uncultured Draconibacterium sp. TaxID=1573823 RepID=UPI0025F63E6A|nr:sensor histidine kinase [uncultured Draconibacterium sp.]
MKRLCCLLIINFALLFVAFPQQFTFSNYSITEGLSQSVVNCLFQDSQGFIWLGTQNGLNRFDGESFKVFRFQPNDSASISNNWIYAISEDKDGNLWIGTKGGLNKYVVADNRFVRICYQTNYPSDITLHSYDNLQLNDGRMLIHTPPVISIFNNNSNEFSHYQSQAPFDPAVKDVKQPVLQDHTGKIWAGCTNGIGGWEGPHSGFECYNFVRKPGDTLATANVTALFQDNKYRIWVGCTNGLFSFNPKSQCFEEHQFQLENGEAFKFSSCIRSLVETKHNQLIVGTEGEGIFLLTELAENRYAIQNFTSDNSGLAHNIVQSLLIDSSENLWVGTLSGVSKADLKRDKFRLYRNSNSPASVNLMGNVIAGMLKNSDGKLWIGNWGQGLNIVDPETNEVVHYSSQHPGNHHLSNDFVHVIFKDNSERIWLGTRNGIFIWDEGNERFEDWRDIFKRPNWPAFTNTRIYHIIQDKKEQFWIGTSNGLFNVNPKTGEFIHFNQHGPDKRQIGSNLVYSLLEDSDGLIWIATIGGLDLYNPETNELKHYRKTVGGLSSDFVISLCEDSLNRIWIGTNAAINIFDKQNQKFSYFDEKDGLPSNYIYAIIEDKNNDLWLATGNGLCRFLLDEKRLQTFTSEDGLQSPEFNLRAAYCANDGELLFGGMNGFNTFYPDSLRGNPYLPNMVFTAFRTNTGAIQKEENIATTTKIVLSHKVQSFTIEFAALEFTNPQKNRYAYKMEGVADEWIEIGNRKFVPFFALPLGDYTFAVKGSNNDGTWNENGISLAISILPPWYTSRYAYLAYFFILMLVVWVFIYFRERRLQLDKVKLEKKVLERTIQIEKQNQVIRAKNNELNELNRAKDKFFSIIGHDLRNHFNIIIGFSENLLLSFKKMDPLRQEHHIANIYKSSVLANDLLGNLLTWARLQRNVIVFQPEKINIPHKIRDLLRFHEEAALKKNILIEVFAREELEACVDENMFATIIRNLLANAIKFTHVDGEISVTVLRENNCCVVKVKDNGIGITKENQQKIFQLDSNVGSKGTRGEKGTGLGLIICKEFIEKHRGEISLKSEPGKGSEFTFTLPIQQAMVKKRKSPDEN